MIDVRVRQYHGVDGRRRKGKVPVALLRPLYGGPDTFRNPEVAPAVGFELVHGAGDRSGSSPESEFHREFSNPFRMA